MSIKSAINQILDKADACGVLVDGLEIGKYTRETGKGETLPVVLCDDEETVISDDRELDETRAALRARGWTSAASVTGTEIYARSQE